jgi:hypothetical protein
MTMNLIAREIVIDGDDCVEHAASPFFFAAFFARNIFFNRLEFCFIEVILCQIFGHGQAANATTHF